MVVVVMPFSLLILNPTFAHINLPHGYNKEEQYYNGKTHTNCRKSRWRKKPDRSPLIYLNLELRFE
ncbi:hypothetical protein AAHE18_03G096700 [Arachis hypogaea]